MKNKLNKLLAGECENHILPFFWQHGEDDETLLEELKLIRDSGVGSLCIESRPHDGFVTDSWWDDVRLIFNECRKYGMDAWILDDKYFPTGYCNGAIPREYPDKCKRAITEKHMDICGPIKDGAVIFEGWAEEEDELIGIIVCRCGENQTLTGECYDITDKLNDGLIYVTLPEGIWRVFFIFERPIRDGRVDFTNPESVDVMFSEIYEPHYENLKEYFGNTFKGFFSDEPFILDRSALPIKDANNSHGRYPWNKYIKEELVQRAGDKWLEQIPSLWFPMSGISPKYRVDYMNAVTELYKKNFSVRIGDWCRNHGIMYVGHIVEDHNQHLNFSSGGHYFRALDGQDMAGIDVVLNQIVPGMTNHPNATPCWYDIADPDFFHYSLAKLGASHSHIQPEKAGRALCEIYGAYGWAEGLKMMKWLTDHMLVRGINYFVPHAFSAKFPDEVPPQFTGAGHNPQFPQFRILMEYMNRVSNLLSDGVHRSDAAILYHAESEWSGGDYMYFYTPAKILTQGHIDFDIIPSDYLLNSEISNGKMVLSKESYPCIIVPTSEYLPENVLNKLKLSAESGVDVVFINKLTQKSCEHPGKRFPISEDTHMSAVSEDNLVMWMRERGHYDVTTTTPEEFLRFYHYFSDDGKTHAYMLTNEGINDTIETSVSFRAFDGGNYCIYFPMENVAYERSSKSNLINLKLEPYESVILLFGDVPDGLPEFVRYKSIKELDVGHTAKLSLYEAEGYPDSPTVERTLSNLINITGPDMYPHFGGYMKYSMTFSYIPEGKTRPVIDLGYVGETAEVYVNGSKVGEKFFPPYQFDISGAVHTGENNLEVIVTNHLGYEQRDLCSKYMVMEPSGLLGPVKLKYTIPYED